jgi:hypothetical protein
MNVKNSKYLLLPSLGAGLLLILLLSAVRTAAAPPPHLGYGFNVAQLDVPLLQSVGFDWIKLFGAPGDRLPVNVLLRVDANASHLNNINAFAADLEALAQANGEYIEAYEIGNEVNLDASYGWGTSPDATAYVSLLCAAYTAIKSADPAAVVVSAGLAPTGRVTGNWNGHNGHNGLYQDEREYLREFAAAGGGECTDVIGYHPYGFRADYDAPPDVSSGDPNLNCANGFCFRGAESFYQVMQEEGLGDKMVWATEVGWIVMPPAECLSDPSFQGREWQLVSPEKQAGNLAGAFQYADENWPWMGMMFVFNLNFNVAPWYPQCEQMRYYGVQDRPAEDALRDMPKNPAPLSGFLWAAPPTYEVMHPVSAQPFTLTLPLALSNAGYAPLTYTAAVLTGTDLLPTLPITAGTLNPGEDTELSVLISVADRPVGTYSGGVRLEAPAGVGGVPITVPIKLRLVDTLYGTYLPIASN